ncbi:MAG: MoxR family ATPase [Pleurocapsa sp. SU_196_0]|nr:MoxR family ATPase [Pleurocapsa sp. SU_196_0]
MSPQSVEATLEALEVQGYVAERSLATAVFLALKLQRPLFLEGEPGVGKTEITKVLARTLETPLIRLQCYEGLDVSSAVYEWDYARQMLEIRLLEAGGSRDASSVRREVFSEAFLVKRPLLRALEGDPAPVLLIDELDRADEEFEAFLLEFLSEWQITVPEIGSIRATHPPVVVITSNRTREIHDALKRRCLYHWIDYPDFDKELRIVREKVPGIPQKLSQQIVSFTQSLRTLELYKAPGIAETLDWAASLMALEVTHLEPGIVEDTFGALLKYQDDIVRARAAAQDLLARAQTV